MPPIAMTAVDQRIWNEELADFVPQRIFDIHTHIYRWAFNLDPNKETSPMKKLLGEQFANATWDLANQCDEILMPGRAVHRLSFPFPFPHPCDFDASNEFIAAQTKQDPMSGALMLVHPGMTAEFIDQQVQKFGFLGLKPYRFYAASGDAVECSITDFLPEHQIDVAHRRGLLLMMHVSKRDAIADPQNSADMVRLSAKFPNARWVLAHCARSYSDWPILKAADALRRLPNVWYDVSSVCESDAIETLCSTVGVERVMYGSDDIPIGLLRGKYIVFGFAWAYLSEINHSLGLTHCESQMTFTRYEQLRAMRRAARRLGLSRRQVEAMFFDTAFALVQSARGA